MVPETHESPQAYIWPRERMDQFLQTLEEEGDADKLHAVDRREELAEAIRNFDPAINGNVGRLIEQLATYQREAGRKQEWTQESEKSWPRKLWEKAIGTIKAHPRITTALVLGAGGAALYYSGWGAALIERVRAWIMSFLPSLQSLWAQIPKPNIPTPGVPTIPPSAPPILPPSPSVPSFPSLPQVPNPGNLVPLLPTR